MSEWVVVGSLAHTNLFVHGRVSECMSERERMGGWLGLLVGGLLGDGMVWVVG